MGKSLVAVLLIEALPQRSCRPVVSRHYGCALLQRVDNLYREPLRAIHISVIRSCDLENYDEMLRSFWSRSMPPNAPESRPGTQCRMAIVKLSLTHVYAPAVIIEGGVQSCLILSFRIA